jgi:hypothetical protein
MIILLLSMLSDDCPRSEGGLRESNSQFDECFEGRSLNEFMNDLFHSFSLCEPANCRHQDALSVFNNDFIVTFRTASPTTIPA